VKVVELPFAAKVFGLGWVTVKEPPSVPESPTDNAPVGLLPVLVIVTDSAAGWV
jgi:hypothetical protein